MAATLSSDTLHADDLPLDRGATGGSRALSAFALGAALAGFLAAFFLHRRA